MAHQDGAYPVSVALSKVNRSISIPSWVGCLSIGGIPPPALYLPVPHLYTWVERGTVRVKCLAQGHNTMSLARAWSRNTWSEGKHTNRPNYEALTPHILINLNLSLFSSQKLSLYQSHQIPLHRNIAISFPPTVLYFEDTLPPSIIMRRVLLLPDHNVIKSKIPKWKTQSNIEYLQDVTTKPPRMYVLPAATVPLTPLDCLVSLTCWE